MIAVLKENLNKLITLLVNVDLCWNEKKIVKTQVNSAKSAMTEIARDAQERKIYK